MDKTVEKTIDILLDDKQLEIVHAVLTNIFDSVDMFYNAEAKSLSLLLINKEK